MLVDTDVDGTGTVVVAFAVVFATTRCGCEFTLILIARGDFARVCFAIVCFDATCRSGNRAVLTNPKDEQGQAVVIRARVVVITFTVIVAAEDVDDVLAVVVHT